MTALSDSYGGCFDACVPRRSASSHGTVRVGEDNPAELHWGLLIFTFFSANHHIYSATATLNQRMKPIVLFSFQCSGCIRISAQTMGILLVDGAPCTREWLPANIAMVSQFDNLLPTSTIRECLMFAARLKLPSVTTDAEVKTTVDKIIDELELTHRADFFIG
eukprot:492569-Amorphochlora_amoeboformis.AAC.1